MARWGRRALVALLGLVAASAAFYAVLALAAARRAPRPVHEYFGTPAPNVAHRGGNRQAPEATLPAFAAAAAAGADVLEMDVHVALDGALVVIHDPLLDRTTDGQGRVAALPLAALRSLNAGHRFRTADGAFPYRGAPVAIPTFDEVAAAHPDLRFMVEMKTGDAAEPLCDAIRAAGRASRTLVGAFRQESLDRFRKICPEVPTTATFREVVLFLGLSFVRLAALYEGPPNALFVSEASGPITVVTPKFLQAARRAGLPVFVWTVNDRTDMTRLLNLGVDGILTDDPAALAEVIATIR